VLRLKIRQKEILESNTKPNFRTYSCLMIDCARGGRYSDCNPEKCIKEIKTWRRQRQNLINGRIFHEKHISKINKLLAGLIRIIFTVRLHCQCNIDGDNVMLVTFC